MLHNDVDIISCKGEFFSLCQTFYLWIMLQMMVILSHVMNEIIGINILTVFVKSSWTNSWQLLALPNGAVCLRNVWRMLAGTFPTKNVGSINICFIDTPQSAAAIWKPVCDTIKNSQCYMKIPGGLVVRIRRSHRRGRGSIPRLGIDNFSCLN